MGWKAFQAYLVSDGTVSKDFYSIIEVEVENEVVLRIS